MTSLESNAIAVSTESTASLVNHSLLSRLVEIKQLENVPDGKKRAMMKALFLQEGYRGSAR